MASGGLRCLILELRQLNHARYLIQSVFITSAADGTETMAEEWGQVVIKTNDELMSEIKNAENGDAAGFVQRLAAVANVDRAILDGADCRIGDVELQGGYALLNFSCSDWSRISTAFVGKGSDIEYYFSGQDEYGTAEFFALNHAGERFGYAFDQGGDAWDIDGYEDEVTGKLKEWKSKVPDALKAAFPSFTDTSELMFYGP